MFYKMVSITGSRIHAVVEMFKSSWYELLYRLYLTRMSKVKSLYSSQIVKSQIERRQIRGESRGCLYPLLLTRSILAPQNQYEFNMQEKEGKKRL